MKILNLYPGVGGNRAKWPNSLKITAVELNPEIAEVYQKLYPNDNVIVGDAHDYLLRHFDEYDFIWSSPPCQTHSRMRHHLGVGVKGFEKKYPDMRLYEEILFLKEFAKCKWVVENVIPWYEPFLSPVKINRHLYWSNFQLSRCNLPHENLRAIQIPELQKMHGIDLSAFKIKNKRQVLRNCVSPDVGLSIFKDFVKDRYLSNPFQFFDYPELFNFHGTST